MLTNFELKRLKPKLDIVEKPENRVHKLTDSNGALKGAPASLLHCAIKMKCIKQILKCFLNLSRKYFENKESTFWTRSFMIYFDSWGVCIDILEGTVFFV